MAIRTFYIADDNLGLYGKLTATAIDNTTDNFVETNVSGQYGLVNFSQSYIRNPYCFADNNIFLYRMIYDSVNKKYTFKEVNSSTDVSISAFGDTLVFGDLRTTTGGGPFSVDYTDSYCRTLRKGKYSTYDSTSSAEDLLDTLVLSSDVSGATGSFVLPVNKSTLGDYGYDMYLLYSKFEEINGEVFAIIRGDDAAFQGKAAFGTAGSVFNVSDYGTAFSDVSLDEYLAVRTKFLIGNLDATTGDWAVPQTSYINPVSSVQSLVFIDTATTLVAPSEYSFEIDVNLDMYITFNTALTAPQADNMIIVLIRNDSPDLTLKSGNGFAGNGFYIQTNNVSYPIIEANYRVR